MRKLLSFIILLICATQSMAQELSVKEFREATTDISARTLSRQDINGNDCALVKVQLVVKGTTFGGNVIGETHYMGSAYWVYMADGSKFLKINAPIYLPLIMAFEEYGINKLIAKCTYVLRIVIP